jgi:DNA polymerase I
MEKLLLIDGHALIYRMYHAMAPLTSPENEPVGAVYGLAGLLLKIRNEIKPDYIVACFDRKERTFRKEKYEEYKAHRQPMPDDLVAQLLKVKDVFDVYRIKQYELPGFEADDLIGTFAEKLKKEKDLQIVILSGDRDLLQLVEGDKVVVRLMKNGGDNTAEYNEARVKEEYGLDPKQIIELKGLVGDTSDNIPGVEGVGPKTATPLLQEFKTIDELYENLMIVNPKVAKKFEGKKDVAILSRDLATIHRNAPIFLDALEDLRMLPLDKPALTAFFNKYAFTSLLHRLEDEVS